jgi:hypothetical protein
MGRRSTAPPLHAKLRLTASDEAKNAARQADLAVLMAGLVAAEGADQPEANMLNDQNRMLDELLGINPTTVAVMKDSNPVLMPWIDKAPAVLEVWNSRHSAGYFGHQRGELPTPSSRPINLTVQKRTVDIIDIEALRLGQRLVAMPVRGLGGALSGRSG